MFWQAWSGPPTSADIRIATGPVAIEATLAGRLLRYPYEMPVGVVLGVVGAGLFLALLFRRPADA